MPLKEYKNCGIYKITSPSGKVYIGQSANMAERVRKYKYAGCKKQRKLYNSLKKYGFKNHQFDIIEYCAEENLNCSERFWQDEFDVLSRNGLNCILQDCGEQRQVRSRESVELSIKSNTGRKATLESRIKRSFNTKMGKNHRAKKVINTKTNTIYGCIKEAALVAGVSRDTLARYLNGVTENKTDFEYLDEILRPSNITYNGNSKLILDLNTGVYYYSMREASKVVPVCPSNFSKMLNGHIENTTGLIKC